MINPSDDRTPIAVASQWVTRVITVSLEMVVPGLLALWVDRRLGTRGFLAMLGFAGGMALAFWHLLRMTRNPIRLDPCCGDARKSTERGA